MSVAGREKSSEAEQQSRMVDIMNELIDEVSLGLCFEVHRSCKMGTLFLDETDPQSERQHAIVDKQGVDVFGHVPSKKQFECVCPNCQRNLAASRFAPHLEKCMGMGRNSSRIASRRIANVGKRDSDDSGDDDNDSDWSGHTEKKPEHAKVRKLKRQDRRSDSPRRTKSLKPRNGDYYADAPRPGTPESGPPVYESMTRDERKALLLSTCGVISEHTKKMCTRSHKCPQHSDDQRRSVRQYLLGHALGITESEDIQVDIDSFDDTDSQSLRETLQWEAGSNPSPADSTSTNNSTSSRKRSGKSSSKSHSKKKKSKSSSSQQSNIANLYDFS
ncbi:ataxin-7-like protein 3 [Liolophura sinensis]|uniref:ataxin-7-like protein 3 n=1 Tax=Liolophura sinensis TaxID=3198878 RepID=UPI0031596682